MNDTMKIFENVDESLYWDSTYLYADLNRSLIFTISDRLKYAVETITQIINQNPKSYLSHFNRGIIYYMTGMYNDAIRDFELSQKFYEGNDMRIKNLMTKLIRISKFNS